MPSGPHPPSRNLEKQVSELLVQLLSADRAAQESVCESLCRLLPTHKDLEELLRQKRSAARRSVYLSSLRLDVARRAVRQAAVEFCTAVKVELRGKAPEALAVWFIGRVNELALSGPSILPAEPTIDALSLFDSGHYLRGRRGPEEDELMALLEEAFRDQDTAACDRAFGRLLSWAYEITYAACHDPHLSDDVVMDAVTSVLRNILSQPRRGHRYFVIDITHKIRSTIFGFRSKKGKKWHGLLADHIAARRRRREVSLDDATSPDGRDARWIAVADPDNDAAASLGDPGKLYEAINAHLQLFRDSVLSDSGDQRLRTRARSALAVVLEVLEHRLATARQIRHPLPSIVVVDIDKTWTVHRNALSELRQRLKMQREKRILERLWNIKGQLILAGVMEPDLALRPGRKADLRARLSNLADQRRLADFAIRRREKATIAAVCSYWVSFLDKTDGEADDEEPLSLPPLFDSHQRVHVAPDVSGEIMARLHLSGPAAHNAIKRHVPLLLEWGMAQEHHLLAAWN